MSKLMGTCPSAYERVSAGEELFLLEARSLLESRLDAALAEVRFAFEVYPKRVMMEHHQYYVEGGVYAYGLVIAQSEGQSSHLQPYKNYVQPWAVWWADANATPQDRVQMRRIFETLTQQGVAVRTPKSVYPEVERALIEGLKGLSRPDAKEVVSDLENGKLEIMLATEPRSFSSTGERFLKSGQFGVVPARTGEGFVGVLAVDPEWFMRPSVNDDSRLCVLYHEAVKHYQWWKQGNRPTKDYFRSSDYVWTLEDVIRDFEDEYQAYKGDCELARALNLQNYPGKYCDLAGTDFPAAALVEFLAQHHPHYRQWRLQLLEYVSDRR